MSLSPAPKEKYPDLEKPERKSITVLQERRTYLLAKLQSGNCSTGARSFLQAEADAIAFALEEIDAIYCVSCV